MLLIATVSVALSLVNLWRHELDKSWMRKALGSVATWESLSQADGITLFKTHRVQGLPLGHMQVDFPNDYSLVLIARLSSNEESRLKAVVCNAKSYLPDTVKDSLWNPEFMARFHKGSEATDFYFDFQREIGAVVTPDNKVVGVVLDGFPEQLHDVFQGANEAESSGTRDNDGLPLPKALPGKLGNPEQHRSPAGTEQECGHAGSVEHSHALKTVVS